MARLAPLTVLLLVGSLVLVSGCGDPRAARANPAFSARSTGGPFIIGLPEQFERPGVYTRFANEHGVFLVSAHDMLVALADTCPNPVHGRTAGVRWDPVSFTFSCPVCAWKFTSNGLPIADGNARADTPGGVAPRALERCVIRHYGPLYDPSTEVQVNPTEGPFDEQGRPKNRLVQERNEWSDPAGIYAFETPEGNGKRAKTKRILPVFQ